VIDFTFPAARFTRESAVMEACSGHGF